MNLLGLSLPLHILFSCSFTFSPFNHFRPLSMAIMKMKDSDLALCKQNVYWTCNVCFHAPVIILSKHFFSPAESALINNTSMLEVLFALSRYWMGISFDNTKPQHEVDEGREKKSSCKINQWDFSSSNELSCAVMMCALMNKICSVEWCGAQWKAD